MRFPARIRRQSDSLIITIPNEVVEKLKLKENEVEQFEIKKEVI